MLKRCMIDEFSVNNFCSCKFFSTWKHFQISPLCSECKGKLWPAVVFFGDVLDSQVLRLAFEEAENCDFLLAVGSSLVVHPAAGTPQIAKKKASH